MSHQPALDNLKDLEKKGRLSSQLPSMRGFDPQYKDIVDFIVRITHRIWEEGDMGYIYDTYTHNCTVHTAYGTGYGVEDVVSGSVQFLAALPDRRMYAEDVIWTGDDEAGFHTSHLIVNTGSNTGYSPWGAPTGKRVTFLAIANCFVKANRVVEEWLVRDTAALVRQLGFDVWEVAWETAWRGIVDVVGETDRLQGQLPPPIYEPLEGHSEVETFARRHFHEVWNGRHFNRLAEDLSTDAVLFAPNNVQVMGPGNIRAYTLGMVAMFPDAHMNVEHVYALGNDEEGYRSAVRWRFTGTHERRGWYGKATGRRVNVLGVSHLHVHNGKIKKHYMVFDELALIMQLVSREAS